MKCRNLWAAFAGVVFLTCMMITVDGDAQPFPSLENLRQRNVALEMDVFVFTAGMNPNGRPNGIGLGLAYGKGHGSGFIAGEDGSIITNYHVARRTIRGRATFDDGTSYEIRHIKVYDSSQDLAILKLSANKIFPTVRLGNPAYVQPLDRVLAVGNPGGRGINMTEGQVSQIVRDDYDKVATIVHTAPIAPGSSGGALYKGPYVIGVNASIILDPHGSKFNNAIPINKAQRLLQQYYTRNIPLRTAFPNDLNMIYNKYKQIDGVNGRVPAAKGKKPGMYPLKFRFSKLVDYLIHIDSPGRDLAITIWDSKSKRQIGSGDLRQVGWDKILISSVYPKNVVIYIDNYDSKPANFAIKIGYIAW